MAYQRPASTFRNVLGSSEFPFADGRYMLYVALACPWANGVLQVARLKGLVGPLRKGNAGVADPAAKMRVAVVHPTWQYTDPEVDTSAKRVKGLAGGISTSELHAGWVFANAGAKLLPLAVFKNGEEIGVELDTAAAYEFSKDCLKSSQAGFVSDTTSIPAEAFRNHGVSSEYSTVDPSKHGCKTLRHFYEKCEGTGVRPTTPVIFDTETGRIVCNESIDIAKFLNEW